MPLPARDRHWGEVWWVGEEHRWLYVGDEKTSETYSEQITRCPSCGRLLERKNLRALSSVN